MRSRTGISFLTVVLTALFFSCQKKWKETTQMNVSFSFSAPMQTARLSINSLSFTLDKFKFSGVRKQGGNVLFESKVARQFSIGPGGAQVLSYDIPQGDYTEIAIDLSYSRTDTNAVFTINGVYTDSVNVDKQVVIQVATSVFTNSVGNNGSGGSEIVLTKGKPASAMIALSPAYWMQTIGDGLFEAADCDSLGSAQYIYINKYKNQSIYQAIVNRINVTPAITIH